MKSAIEVAWEENLKCSEDCQYESKEEIINELCPRCNCFKGIDLDTPYYCTDGDDDEKCTKCWNREVKEDIKVDVNDEKKLTFKDLEYSPIEAFCLDSPNEEKLIEDLKNNEVIIFSEGQEVFTYDKIPLMIKWLQDVYAYCTELKNKPEYVDFNKAKEHMYNGDLARYEGYNYYINNGELFRSDDNKSCALSLQAIESDKWILL